MKFLKFSCVMITAWLSVWPQRATGQDVVIAGVGETATLTAPVIPNITSFSWFRGPVVTNAQRIFSYAVSGSTQNNGPQYTGLEKGLPDGSLQIRDLKTSYSGDYTVTVIDIDMVPIIATRHLQVYENLSQPSLLIASGLEFNGYNMTLKCEARNQTVGTYLFLKDNVNITCDQRRITCNDSSPFLHFRPIMTSDNGDYTCGIYNPISRNTSRPREIRVKEPISDVTISSNETSAHLWENEGSVNLTCSALGTEPTFSWTYNGSALPEGSRYQLSPDRSSLVISPVTRGDTGPFVCIASNPANMEPSWPLHLNISLRPNGRIQCRAQKISDGQVELSCSWPGGSPSAKVHLQLPPSIINSASDEVKRNVSRSDINPNMTMTCRGEQEGYSDNCYLSMGLPHGPAIEQNNTLTGGQSVMLTVNLLASSQMSLAGILPATFTWINGTSIVGSGGRVKITSNDSFSQMVISNAMESDSGDYVCRAENLMGTTNFSFRVQVSPAPETQTTTTPLVTHPNDNPGGLSAGAIAGIVVGVIAVLVIIGVTVYCVLKKQKDKELRTSNSDNILKPFLNQDLEESLKKNVCEGDSNVMQMNDPSKQDEVNYAVLKFNNNNQQQIPAPDYPNATETLYAQVKKK